MTSKHGLQPEPRALSDYFRLTPAKELSTFLDFTSYCRRIMHNSEHETDHLTALFKKGASWQWGSSEQAKFLEIKHVLLSLPTTVHFNDNAETIVHTDSSHIDRGHSCCSWMCTKNNVADASRWFGEFETRYYSFELECLVLVWTLKKFGLHVYSHSFVALTDSAALTWLQSK